MEKFKPINFPQFLKNDTAYACVLSPDDYIMVRVLETSTWIKYGPSKVEVKDILERYQPISQDLFLYHFQSTVNQLTDKYEKIFRQPKPQRHQSLLAFANTGM